MPGQAAATLDPFGLVGEMVGQRFLVAAVVAEGGFGVVYRARHLALDRDVALKVLKAPAPAAGRSAQASDFRRAFEAEARTIARLQHPGIVAVFDFGVWERPGGEAVHYIAFEWLEGRSLEELLAERRRAGLPPFSPLEALALLRPVLEAMALAHRRGVAHRDLKPGNVFLHDIGELRVTKVLDFGIARLVSPDEAATADLATTRGFPAFSPDYAAPEQVSRGRTGPWTDVHAIGLMLTELLTGRRPYARDAGDQATGPLDVVLDVRRPTPGSMGVGVGAWEPVLARALARRPADRHPDASALLAALEAALPVARRQDRPAERRSEGPVATSTSRRRGRLLLTLGLAAAVGVTAAVALSGRRPTSADRSEVVRFTIQPPERTAFWATELSPDGRRVLFVTYRPDGLPSLWIRALDELEARPLPDTDMPRSPFWSPDGQAVGFFAEQKLRIHDLRTGVTRVVGPGAAEEHGASWSPGGEILFARPTGALMVVPAIGGELRPATTLDRSRGETSHHWPSFLPDGRHFIYGTRRSGEDGYAIAVASLDTPRAKVVGTSQGRARYSPPGFLLYLHGTTLMARRFDVTALEPAGDAFRVTGDPLRSFSVSATGVLAYLTATVSTGALAELVWFDRTGKRVGTLGETGLYSAPTLSRDGTRVGVGLTDPANKRRDVWAFTPAQARSARITTSAADEDNPVFSPDATRIFFWSNRNGSVDTYSRAVDGVGEGDLVAASQGNLPAYVDDVSPDGRFLLYNTGAVTADVWLAPVAGGKHEPLLVRPAIDHQPQFSPDGKWVSFTSTDTGRREVFIQNFPGATRRTKISVAGGTEGRWRADMRELFYLEGNRRIMSVALRPHGGELRLGAPRALFEARFNHQVFHRNRYTVSPDGQRFLIVTPRDDAQEIPMTVVVNWHQGLASAR